MDLAKQRGDGAPAVQTAVQSAAAAALGASDIAPRSRAIVIPDPVPDGMAAGAASTDGQNASQPAGHDTRNVDIFFVGEW